MLWCDRSPEVEVGPNADTTYLSLGTLRRLPSRADDPVGNAFLQLPFSTSEYALVAPTGAL